MSATEKAGTHTWAEQEAELAMRRARRHAVALTQGQNLIDALNVANADERKPFATMYDVPTVGKFAALASEPPRKRCCWQCRTLP
jgi:type III secretion system FlhB-like substrate exporter